MVEVSVGGVEVVNGSTLSTTGEMQVTCNVPYVLSVDGVEWSPISSVGGVDTYVLSTSGVVRILVNGIRYFYFVNSLSVDFNIGSSILYQRETSQGDNLTTAQKNGSYVQDTFDPNCRYVIIYVNSPAKTPEELIALGFSTSQGEIRNTLVAGRNANLWVGGINPSEHLEVYCGNVLTTYVTASE